MTQVLHTTTWGFFTSRLPDLFIHSPKALKEAIMTDIDDLVQMFWTSSDGAVEVPFFAMLRLLEILEVCFDKLEVCFDIISFIDSDFADKIYRCPPSRRLTTESEPNWRYCLMGIEINLIRHFLM